MMRQTHWTPVLLAVLTMLSGHRGPAAAQQAAMPRVAPPLVLDRVTVIDVEHGMLRPAQRVVIAGTRIRAMGKAGAVKVPPGAQVIDARGKYLIPGLWDMHVHPFEGLSDREREIAPPLAYYQARLQALLANGVLGFRDAGSAWPLDSLRRWRRETLAGVRVGPPRQIFSGPAIETLDYTSCDRRLLVGTYATCVADSADARHVIDSLQAAGADMIKLRSISKEMYFVAAAEARRRGIPFGGHTDHVSERDASDSDARIIDHGLKQEMERFCLVDRASTGSADCRLLVERLRRNGTWFVPTALMVGAFSQDAIYYHYSQFFQKFQPDSAHPLTPWPARLGGDWLYKIVHSPEPLPASWGRDSISVGFAQRFGLPLLAGTDAGAVQPFGFSLHAELTIYVADGLTPLAALQSATLNPAKALRLTDSLGTVAAGKLADLVLLDANPLADITNTARIRAVVANGRYYDRAALDRLLVEVPAGGRADGQTPERAASGDERRP